jgi:hypothetical protein
MNLRALLAALLFLLLALFLLVPGQAAPLADIDPRLHELGVIIEPAQNCASGCWRLITARYEDVDESGLNHNVYSRLYDEQGDMIAGAPWHVAWPDGDIAIYTKAPPEWADFPIFACFNPANGPGPYRAYAGPAQSQSDVLHGLGLPLCQHVNYRLEWQWQASMNLEPRLWLPVVRR